MISSLPPQPFKKDAGPAVLRIVLFAISLWFTCAVLYITLARIAYPFDLEWMEGGSLVQLLRLLDGKPLYVAPGLEYIPYIYPPFYYYLSAVLAKMTAVSWFLPLRLVSLGASAGIALLIYKVVRSQTHSAYWAFIASGFFAATFQIGGAWFDIARVDMLFVFLLMAATFFLEKDTWPASLLAGLLFTCAFFTKQTAIFGLSCILAYVFIFRNRRVAILAGLVFLTSASAWVYFENIRSDGWFWYYVFTLPGLHSLPALGLAYLGQPLIILVPVSIASGVGFVRFFSSPLLALKDRGSLWLVFSLIMLVSSITASLNPGSYNNNYIPFYAAISILFGSRLPELLEQFAIRRQSLRQALLYILCIAQFVALFYSPLAQVPTSADLQAGQALVARLKAVEGDVLIPNHNTLAILAGKRPYAHLIALQEIRGNFGRQETDGWNLLNSEISTALQTHKFSAIVLDQPNAIWADVPEYYTGNTIPYSSDAVFWPVTGGRTRPRTIYTRP